MSFWCKVGHFNIGVNGDQLAKKDEFTFNLFNFRRQSFRYTMLHNFRSVAILKSSRFEVMACWLSILKAPGREL